MTSAYGSPRTFTSADAASAVGVDGAVVASTATAIVQALGITSNALAVKSSGNHAAVVIGTAALTDPAVTGTADGYAEGDVTSPGTTVGAGVLYRHAGPPAGGGSYALAGYAAVLVNSTSGTVRILYLSGNAVSATVASYNAPSAPGTGQRHLRVEVQGTTHRVYLDGALVITATHTGATTGRYAGAYAMANAPTTVRIDNLDAGTLSSALAADGEAALTVAPDGGAVAGIAADGQAVLTVAPEGDAATGVVYSATGTAYLAVTPDGDTGLALSADGEAALPLVVDGDTRLAYPADGEAAVGFAPEGAGGAVGPVTADGEAVLDLDTEGEVRLAGPIDADGEAYLVLDGDGDGLWLPEGAYPVGADGECRLPHLDAECDQPDYSEPFEDLPWSVERAPRAVLLRVSPRYRDPGVPA